MMCEGKFIFLAFAFLVLTAFASVSAAKTIYVPDDYLTIQSAVNAASTGDTIIVRDGLYKEHVIVNKQLTIKSERGYANCVVNGEGSDVFALYADGIRIEGFTITGGRHGIFINSNNNSISNNNISSNNEDGIYIPSSNNNIISNNIISNNDDGISLWYSNNNCISDNIISNNNNGTYIYHSNNNSISNNNILNNGYGIYLEYSNGTNILNNNISNNGCGIYLWYSNKSSISYNNISYNGYGIILGWCYYGYSNENSISYNNISYNGFSIVIYGSGNIISNNNISSNYYNGVGISGSNNIISNNIICSNKWEGLAYAIFLYSSNNNIIYMNNFINNTCNVYSYNSTNIWNSTEPITYTYRGSEITNYMGNYWDDYTGSDANGDGIGETPYIIDENNTDNYPLIEGFENYLVETPTPTPAQTFDTGRPENPYPSISGKFIGTIKTNKKIIARKLYTYACEGTGGHTEYALICNKTWCAEAKWEGYKEDWMNISFNRTVVLMPYETYNITIVTGSYPQIHHTASLKTENGWINCTEFTDANGKKYNDWIPAIMLWS
ncbi:MAG: right-handed parallel beta-helix repeat-containing protein [Candidatus Methanospirare jalkutatii]|nr:right-handed parallel beta-helix repeat-containing protein [Candidatus Methanospirare jalkutatii]